jgi:Skp family chaperone for outer membrane proteins
MARLSPALWCATLIAVSAASMSLAAATNVIATPASAAPVAAAAAPATPQQALTLKVKELWQRQHDLEYSDPEIARVRKDIVELERQLVARRKDLADRLARKPEIQQLEQERLTLIRQLQQATPAAAPKP